MPYLTPDEIPEEDACRPLSIPASSEWFAIVSGALTELIQPWNWEQHGAVTVDEAIARMKLMIEAYYEDPCGECILPGGEPILQLSEAGNAQELVEGEWVAPTGDYEIPPVPARTEPTADERKCLAAKNCANVLADVYEDTIDHYQAGGTSAEIFVTFALAIGTLVIPPLGLIAAGLYGMFKVGWSLVFDFFEELTGDYWDDEFTEKLVCILLQNATDTAGVVTFDFPAVQRGCTQYLTSSVDLTFFQQKLALQVGYMLDYLGADALNLAGTTTDITDADCDACQATWALMCDFKVGQGGFGFGVPAGWVSQVSSQYMPTAGFYAAEARQGVGEWLNQIAANRAFVSMEVTKIVVYFTAEQGTTVPTGAVPYRRSIDLGGTPLIDQPNNEGISLTWEGYHSFSAFGENLQFYILNGYRNDNAPVGGGALVTGWYMAGIGTEPALPGTSEWYRVDPSTGARLPD